MRSNTTSMINRRHFPWAKQDQATGVTHHLEHHSADVAACFEALLAEPVVRARFDRAAESGGLDELTLARLVVLAFLHDFGKISTNFQFQTRPKGHLKAAFWACNRPEVRRGIGLEQALVSWGPGVDQLLRAALAHHGRPVSGYELEGPGPERVWKPLDGYDPITAGRDLLKRAREWYPQAFRHGPPLPESPQLAHLFAGMVVFADQVGSNEELFCPVPERDPGYLAHARKQAARAVTALSLGRSGWKAGQVRVGFQDLFGSTWKPRPLQATVANAPLDCPLLVLESETGSGKTEAAIWRFAKLWKAGRVDGLYFALPTRAAAVQLHARVDDALKRVFPREARCGTVLAVPGYIQAGEAHGQRQAGWEVTWGDDPREAERLARWSAESARKFLSAPAAVGTVDQALLSALQVKWSHFRGSALARSLLVVDEVHASDAYMTEILEAVLRGHLEIGGHAMLMSATLGSEARDGLEVPWASRRGRKRTPLSDACGVPYPVLTVSDLRGAPRRERIERGSYRRTVAMASEPILENPARIAEHAIGEARRGARVLVIRNTVGQAQAVFREGCDQRGQDLLLQLAGGPALHHSRFAAEDRLLLDRAVTEALGTESTSGGCIVIGTQTLEQSLDIDADLLVTDLCPVDVLLQRIGRLHRHASRERPSGFEQPRCVTLVPQTPLARGGLLRYGLGMSRSGGVYRDLRVLELTRRLVAEHGNWEIPAMNRMLVEEGTHRDRLAALEEESEDWKGGALDVEGKTAAERKVAQGHALDRRKSFSEVTFPDADDRVRTRLGDDGPRIRLMEAIAGPFGKPVKTFNLPAHLFLGKGGKGGWPTREEIENARAISSQAAGARREERGLVLTVGGHSFWYGRLGIQRAGGRGG